MFHPARFAPGFPETLEWFQEVSFGVRPLADVIILDRWAPNDRHAGVIVVDR